MTETAPVFVHYVHYRQNKISSSKPPVQESVALGVLGHDYDQTLARARQSFPSLDGSARLELCLLPSDPTNDSTNPAPTDYSDEAPDDESVFAPLVEAFKGNGNKDKTTLGSSRTWPRMPRDPEVWRMMTASVLHQSIQSIHGYNSQGSSSTNSSMRPALTIALLETCVDEASSQTFHPGKASLDSNRSSNEGTLVGTEYPPPQSSGQAQLGSRWKMDALNALVPGLIGLFLMFMIGIPAASPFLSYTGPGVDMTNYSAFLNDDGAAIGRNISYDEKRVVTYGYYSSEWSESPSYIIAPVGSSWQETVAIARRIDPHLHRYPDKYMTVNLPAPGIRPDKPEWTLISPEGFGAAMQTDPKPTMIGVVARDRPGQLFARILFVPVSFVTFAALLLGIGYNIARLGRAS